MNEEFGNWTTRPPPVHLACANGSLDILKLLLQGGANVDVGGGLYSMTPLHWACDGGHKDVAAFLISKTGCRIGEFCLGMVNQAPATSPVWLEEIL